MSRLALPAIVLLLCSCGEPDYKNALVWKKALRAEQKAGLVAEWKNSDGRARWISLLLQANNAWGRKVGSEFPKGYDPTKEYADYLRNPENEKIPILDFTEAVELLKKATDLRVRGTK